MIMTEKKQYTKEEVEEIISKIRYKITLELEDTIRHEEGEGSKHASGYIRNNDKDQKALSAKFLYCADKFRDAKDLIIDMIITSDVSYWHELP